MNLSFFFKEIASAFYEEFLTNKANEVFLHFRTLNPINKNHRKRLFVLKGSSKETNRIFTQNVFRETINCVFYSKKRIRRKINRGFGNFFPGIINIP